MRRVVIGITGATGVVLAVRALEVLREIDVESHVVASPAGVLTLRHELGMEPAELHRLASVVHKHSSVGNSIASGSFDTDGMLVVPCSIKTLSAVANSYADNLITRAADVTLKEGRPLALLVRETPLHHGHLELMARATASGAVIIPPMLTLYPKPASIDEMVDHVVRRALVRIGLRDAAPREWDGVATGLSKVRAVQPRE